MYNFLKNVQFKNIFFDLKNSFNFFTTVITKWINNNYKEIKKNFRRYKRNLQCILLCRFVLLLNDTGNFFQPTILIWNFSIT